jgi:hypothetical protein
MSTDGESSPTNPRAEESKLSAANAPKRRRERKSNPPLLFIDTNIFLDFYRTRKDAGISLLSKIDTLHDKIITTCQVEMEFKKNRQKVISESMSLVKPPDFNLATPAFLLEAKNVEMIKTRIKDVKGRVANLRTRILSTLENPQTKDRIYQTMQRLFTDQSQLNLRHDTPEYRAVWRKALRRFLEGRPPRKKDDTSAGDAVNWEWIVRCIEKYNRDVVIVSRDADYGLTIGENGYANNWLAEEVKQRVNQKRKLVLVELLSSALRLFDVEVTREEINAERASIKSTATEDTDEIEDIINDEMDEIENEDEISSLIAQTNASDWHCDSHHLKDLQFTNEKWIAHVWFHLSGEQDDDKPWHGDKISGRCTVTVDKDGSLSFSKIDASLDDDLDATEDDNQE